MTHEKLPRAPDRLFPSEPGVRAIARRLHEQVRDLPVVSPHGHVDAGVLLRDEPFSDPATLLVSPDHYVTRLLHAGGVPLAELGVGRSSLSEPEARHAWRQLCEHWDVFRGTPVKYWLERELLDIFGVDLRPGHHTADDLYDAIAECLTRPEFRPRALYARFGIEVLATTDDPTDDLAAHAALTADPSWTGRVVPTFRPDAYLEPAGAGWAARIGALGRAADVDTGDYHGYVAALERRRRYFVEHGAVSADHSHVDVRTDPLDRTDAVRIFAATVQGSATADEATAFRRHMLGEMARMSCEDGLVMTLHPGVLRSHHPPTFERFGADTGHDIPVQVEFTCALRPLLERYGTHPNLHLVLFTVDETTFSREIAPLAGFYPSVYVGAPWWFLDAPEAIRRHRAAVTETVGFSRSSGFIDDTRAFCSIPARHDMSRRLDAGYVAQLVADDRLTDDEAGDVLRSLTVDQPRRVFKLVADLDVSADP